MNSSFNKKINKKIVLIANTSKYLMHYRFLLINKLNKSYKKLFVISPIDKSSYELKKISRFVPWYLPNKNQFNPFDLVKSFLILFNSIRSIKPGLVHSHTLKPNLLISIINLFLGVKTIISFPGMGRLSNSKGIKNIIFKSILKIIFFTSKYQLKNYVFFKSNLDRVKFIFQNPLDLNFFLKTVKVKNDKKIFHLIPGSGIPMNYFKSKKNYTKQLENQFDFIYCARLEKSKGINLFISLANYYPDSRFFVYGDLNKNSKDYLSYEEIVFLKSKNKNLLFMDYVENPLLRHHNDHSIFLVPSNYGEGLPRGIIEAMSLEIPVIASEKACVGLFDENLLFVASSDQIDTYLMAIENIRTKKIEGKLNGFLSNSKDHVLKRYKESLIVKKTIHLYKSFDLD